MKSNVTGKGQFRPLPVPSVKVSGFWGDWQDAVCNETAGILLDRCEKARMFEQINPDAPNPGIILPPVNWMGTQQMFWDSDVAKCIETIAYSLYRQPNPALEARVDAIVDMYERLQEPDGYLGSFFIRIWPDKRWTNLRDFHELYCAGHLIEAAVAYFQATGKRKFLDVMCRYADLIAKTFGTGPGQMRGYCGHQEIELALVRLARVTGEQKYMDLAKYFIDERGQEPNYFLEEAAKGRWSPDVVHGGGLTYNQSHLPVREQKKVVGHAVRALYMYSGMADIATEYNDDTLTDALEILWDDLTGKQMYITGGIGPSHKNEGFTDYYDLPNDTAYAETCASVALVFWASRMLGRGPNARFADVMEQALYNGAISGLAHDGKTFFYDNPLESTGKHHRWVWHICPCCPPNIARLVTSIGSYIYGVSDDEVAVHLYAASTAKVSLQSGVNVTLTQTTEYPWNGAVAITVDLDKPADFALSLRIPGWAKGATLQVNGTPVALDGAVRDGYARLQRTWMPGDVVRLDIPMEVRAIYAHPKVRQDAGRAALMRGPLVYCLEEADNAPELNSIVLSGDLSNATITTLPQLNGAVCVDLPVEREQAGTSDDLYRETQPARQADRGRFVPYHMWDNRTPGEMLVWVRR